jgi:hypothetical protein
MVCGMLGGLRGRRGWTVAAVAALGVCVAAAAVNGLPSPDSVDVVDSCNLGPTRPEIRTTGHTGYTWPYGEVTGCREFARRADWFGPGDSTEWLVVDTRRGAVLIRLEVTGYGHLRYWQAVGHEAEPEDAPDGLTDDEVRQLRTDIATRKGVRDEPWVFNYGDG